MTTPRLAVAFLGIGFIAVGCSGDGGGGGSRTQPRAGDANAVITDGNYVISDADIHKDNCQLGYSAGDFNGGIEIVTVSSGGAIVVGDTDLTLTNGELTGTAFPVQTDPFGDGSCIVDITQSEEGTVPENDVMEVVQTVRADNPVGAGCGQVPVSLPCETAYFLKFTKQ